MELYNELQYKIKELTVSLKQLRDTGTKLAEAEREYKIILRKEALKLRTEGCAVTLINQIVYGITEVAELRFKRDVSETIYKANQEAINTYKLQIRIIESQVDREYRG